MGAAAVARRKRKKTIAFAYKKRAKRWSASTSRRRGDVGFGPQPRNAVSTLRIGNGSREFPPVAREHRPRRQSSARVGLGAFLAPAVPAILRRSTKGPFVPRTPFAPFRLSPPLGVPLGRWVKAASTAAEYSAKVPRAQMAPRGAPVLVAVLREHSVHACDRNRSARFERCEKATPPLALRHAVGAGRGALAGEPLARDPPRQRKTTRESKNIG